MNSRHILKTFLIILLFHCNFIIPTCLAESDNLEELNYVLKKIGEANKELTSLKADITIFRSIPLLESEEISRGKLQYQKPKRFSIKFEPPRNEIDIIDGKNIWIYHVDLKQVEKYAINNMSSNSFMNTFINFGFDENIDAIKDKYDISMAGNQENIDNMHKNNNVAEKRFYKLILIPRLDETNGPYSEIKLWIQDELWLPVIFELYESGGEILNRIELNNPVINKPDSGENFEFNIPNDVEVIEPLK